MIVIKVKTENNINSPERKLTDDELKTVTSIFCNGNEFIYYQGDEPIITE